MPLLAFAFAYSAGRFLRKHQEHKAQMAALQEAAAWQKPGEFLSFLAPVDPCAHRD